MSTTIAGASHWFNRLPTAHGEYDADLTGDQFGFQPLRFQPAGTLFKRPRRRNILDLTTQTTQRALTLASRAGLPIRAFPKDLRSH